MLSCKPNIKEKHVYECGLVEDANVVSVAETGDPEESPQSSGHANKNSNAELERNLMRPWKEVRNIRK